MMNVVALYMILFSTMTFVFENVVSALVAHAWSSFSLLFAPWRQTWNLTYRARLGKNGVSRGTRGILNSNSHAAGAVDSSCT